MTPDARAQASLAADRPTDLPDGVSEEEVRAKVRVGLDRAQAIDVILRQQEHDREHGIAPAATKSSGGEQGLQAPGTSPEGKPAATASKKPAPAQPTTKKENTRK